MDCQTILECIPDIEQAIIRRGITDPNRVNPDDTTVVNARFPEEIRNQEIVTPLPGCDKDILFGSMREIANRIDGSGRDFWQTAVANVDPIERMADLVDAIPILGNLASPALRSFAQNADTLKEKYEAYQSITLVDEIACDLFQMVCEACRYPTYAEVLQYYAQLGIVGLEQWAEASLQLIVDLLMDTAQSTNALVYYTTNTMLLYLRGVGATVLGQTGIPFIREWALLGSDSPSNDHELLCPCAPPPGPWEVLQLAGNGWRNSKWTFTQELLPCLGYHDVATDSVRGCCPGPGSGHAYTAYGQSATYTRVHARVTVKKTRSGTDNAFRVWIGNTLIINRLKTTLSEETFYFDISGEWTGQIKIDGLTRTNNCSDGGYNRLDYINLYGTGPNPW